MVISEQHSSVEFTRARTLAYLAPYLSEADRPRAWQAGAIGNRQVGRACEHCATWSTHYPAISVVRCWMNL